MILGLDASTSVCGWSTYDGNEIIHADFIDISKIDTNKEKVHHIIDVIFSKINLKDITEIKLEAALSGFMHGRTSQQVVIKLARFNAVLEYVLGEKTGIPVTLINAATARKKVLGKAFIKGMTAKEYVRQELPKKVLNLSSFEKINKKGEWNKKNEDIYDSIIIVMS